MCTYISVMSKCVVICCTAIVYTHIPAPSQVIGVALFKALRNGSPSLTVTWTAPQAHEAISQYQVQYRITGATGWGDQVTVQPNSTSTLLPKLYGITKYDVRVRALSTIENGEWSAVQTERTYFDGEFLHFFCSQFYHSIAKAYLKYRC